MLKNYRALYTLDGERLRGIPVRAAGETEAKTEARIALKTLDTFRGGARTLLWVEEGK